MTRLLYARYLLGLDGFVFLPCELIDRNGDKLKETVLRYASLWGLEQDFCSWITLKNEFCNTLVDRINTGYPKDEKIDLGYEDKMLNTSEYFHLWVIETALDLEKELPFSAAGLNVIITKNELERYRTRKAIVANKPATVDELMGKNMPDGKSVDEALKEISGAILHEKVSIRRFVIVEGPVSTYIHGAGETGVIISFAVEPAAVAESAEFAAFAKNVALQAAAIPSLYVDRASVPQSALDEEMDILKKQMEQDPKFAGKPANVIEGIVKGKMGKYFETNCLLEQSYVKDDSTNC